MHETAQDTDRIAATMRRSIQTLVDLSREAMGDNLLALTAFGSVVATFFDRERHTARNVLVLKRVELSGLRRLAENGEKLGKESIAAPLIMTPAYIASSLDTFPLELLEIQQHHAVVLGDDHFENLTFEETHIRLQCERELKRILIALRQGLLAAAGHVKRVERVERDVAEGLVRTIRGMLWLKGQKRFKPAAEIVGEAESTIGRSLKGLRAALDENEVLAWPEFETLYHDVEALGEIVNAW